MRLVALIQGDASSPTKHTMGLPPAARGSEYSQRELPAPSVLVLEEADEGFYIYRYTALGEFSGDTWHDSLTEAKDQLAFEYPAANLKWITVPDNVEDAIDFAISRLDTKSPFSP